MIKGGAEKKEKKFEKVAVRRRKKCRESEKLMRKLVEG
jgi:hypothetical protein